MSSLKDPLFWKKKQKLDLKIQHKFLFLGENKTKQNISRLSYKQWRNMIWKPIFKDY